MCYDRQICFAVDRDGLSTHKRSAVKFTAGFEDCTAKPDGVGTVVAASGIHGVATPSVITDQAIGVMFGGKEIFPFFNRHIDARIGINVKNPSDPYGDVDLTIGMECDVWATCVGEDLFHFANL